MTLAGDVTLPFTFSFFLGLAAFAGVYEVKDAKDWVQKASEEAIKALDVFRRTDLQVRQRIEQQPIKWLERTTYLWFLSGTILLGHAFLIMTSVSMLLIWDTSVVFGLGLFLFFIGWFHYFVLWYFKNHSTSREPFIAIRQFNWAMKTAFLVPTAFFLGLFAITYVSSMAGMAYALGQGSIPSSAMLEDIVFLVGLGLGAVGSISLAWVIWPTTRGFKAREVVVPLLKKAEASE